MSPEAVEGEAGYVLTVDAVKASITALRKLKIHRFFPAYLHLHQQPRVQGTTTEITANWAGGLGPLIEIPGGPTGRPYYLPFWDQQNEAGQEWRAKNLAGSYSPSSLREVPKRVVTVDERGRYGLRERHWELAREHLTFGEQLPAVILGGFFLRNYAFIYDGPPTHANLATEFLVFFGFEPGSEESDHLFSSRGADEETYSFEPFVALAQDIEG